MCILSIFRSKRRNNQLLFLQIIWRFMVVLSCWKMLQWSIHLWFVWIILLTRFYRLEQWRRLWRLKSVTKQIRRIRRMSCLKSRDSWLSWTVARQLWNLFFRGVQKMNKFRNFNYIFLNCKERLLHWRSSTMS